MPWPMRFGPPPRMTTFLRSDGPRLVGRRAGEGRLVGRVHVGGGRGELGRAGVDALVDRAHVERAAQRARPPPRVMPASVGEARVGEAHAPSAAEGVRRRRQADARAPSSSVSTIVRDLLEEPRVDLAGLVDLLDARCRGAWPARPCSSRSGVGVPSAARMAFLSSPWPRPAISISSRPVRPVSSERSAFCSNSCEGAADRHGLADRLHRRGQRRLGAGELLEGEARDLGDDVVDRRLERGRASRRR